MSWLFFSFRNLTKVYKYQDISPDWEIIEALYETFLYLKTLIESSRTIREDHLGAPVSLEYYGSAFNGLFDVNDNSVNNGEESTKSDLDLTLIIDEEAAKRKSISHKEVLQIIKSKF